VICDAWDSANPKRLVEAASHAFSTLSIFFDHRGIPLHYDGYHDEDCAGLDELLSLAAAHIIALLC
jgi:hypothetical protein